MSVFLKKWVSYPLFLFLGFMTTPHSDRPGLVKSTVENLVKQFSSASDQAEQKVYLVDVELKHGQGEDIVQVFADTDQGIRIDQCKALSRMISEAFETDTGLSQLFPGKYRLEVSSPGLARPLRLERQYQKNIGRLLHVKFKTESNEYLQCEGTLVSIEKVEEAITSLTLKTTKQDKRRPNAKPKQPEFATINFKSIVEAKVKPSF